MGKHYLCSDTCIACRTRGKEGFQRQIHVNILNAFSPLLVDRAVIYSLTVNNLIYVGDPVLTLPSPWLTPQVYRALTSSCHPLVSCLAPCLPPPPPVPCLPSGPLHIPGPLHTLGPLPALSPLPSPLPLPSPWSPALPQVPLYPDQASDDPAGGKQTPSIQSHRVDWSAPAAAAALVKAYTPVHTSRLLLCVTYNSLQRLSAPWRCTGRPRARLARYRSQPRAPTQTNISGRRGIHRIPHNNNTKTKEAQGITSKIKTFKRLAKPWIMDQISYSIRSGWRRVLALSPWYFIL